MSGAREVGVPLALWVRLGDLLGECDVACTVSVPVGSGVLEVAMSVHGFGVDDDDRPIVSGRVQGDLSEVVQSVPVERCSEWVLS